MMQPARERQRWLVVMAFAGGMAWVEAATVYYLRAMTDRIDPYQAQPLPLQERLGRIELVREAATLVMLATVGMLAARRWQKRLAYTVIVFGGWDIFYYVFLRLMSEWPKSLFDWDVLFLLPLPWWGPVWAPVCIASLMIVWGTLVTQRAESGPAAPFTQALWGGVGTLGIALALYVFMADALRSLPHGLDATRLALPTSFNWPVFCAALALIAAPVAYTGWKGYSLRTRQPPALNLCSNSSSVRPASSACVKSSSLMRVGVQPGLSVDRHSSAPPGTIRSL
jgi:hypothetical protein